MGLHGNSGVKGVGDPKLEEEKPIFERDRRIFKKQEKIRSWSRPRVKKNISYFRFLLFSFREAHGFFHLTLIVLSFWLSLF